MKKLVLGIILLLSNTAYGYTDPTVAYMYLSDDSQTILSCILTDASHTVCFEFTISIAKRCEIVSGMDGFMNCDIVEEIGN